VALLLACLLAGCDQSNPPFPAGNHTPVNEAAMPTPEPTALPVTGGTISPAPASTPGTPPPSLVPSPNPLPPGP
jgi:hypothetical protein